MVSTTWYYYDMAGNPTYIVTKPVGSATYSATRFEYAKNGQTVTYVLGETWEAGPASADTAGWHRSDADEEVWHRFETGGPGEASGLDTA